MSSILVPISVIAGDLEDDLNKQFNIGHLDAAAHSVSPVASNSSTTISPFDDNVKPQLTFKHARNLLYFGGTKERQLARIALCEFVQNKESSTFFGKSYSFLSARHLFNSNDNEDIEIAANYFRTIWLDENHNDHQDLVNLLKQDLSLKNKLGNFAFKTGFIFKKTN